MNFNFKDKALDVVGHRKGFFAASAIFLLIGLVFLLLMGLNLSVDFEGGTQLEIFSPEPLFSVDEVADVLTVEGMEPDDIRLAGNENEIVEVLYIGTLTKEEINQAESVLAEQFGDVEVSESTVTPMVARELAVKAIYTTLLASVAVIVYVSIRFEYRFAVAAIIALFHDVLFMIGVFAIVRLQVDLTFIAAVLTIVGYSINDTIIIFDRIRENMKVAKLKTTQDLQQLVNQSVKETLPRTLNTSITVIFASLCLYLLGGEGIRNFSFALTVGLLSGTYSSIFIASQIWFVWKAREFRKKAAHA